MAQLLQVFDISNWVTPWFVIAVIIGFPFAMFFSWFYEWTSLIWPWEDGLLREL